MPYSENSNKKDMTKEKKRFFELTCFGCIVSLNKATFLYQHKLGISFMPIMVPYNEKIIQKLQKHSNGWFDRNIHFFILVSTEV